MAFTSGPVSFSRVAVVGDIDNAPSEELLDKLRAHLLTGERVGMPAELEYGWSGGRHLLDAEISFEHNVFDDRLLFALRIDTHKPAASIKAAYEAIELKAQMRGNAIPFPSKAQRKAAREAAKEKLEQEVRDGRHCRSKLVPVLWDLARGELLTPASGRALDVLREIFERTFGAELRPLTAGQMALRRLESLGRRRDYEDLKPTRFVIGPEGEGQVPEYPWVAKGPEPKEFLGNEFLLWLWREAEARAGVITIARGSDFALAIDKCLDLDCTYGQSGKDALRGDAPDKMPEARDALRSGKVPRKLGLLATVGDEPFALTLSADSLAVGACRLPEVDDADTFRAVYEQRFEHIRSLIAALDTAYVSFLELRCSSAWTGWLADTRKWILAAKPGKAVA